MGIWGSSSYWDRDGRNLITEWTHLDGEIRARNGNKGMQVRRTYTTAIPDSFEYSQAFPDYGKRISAMTINTPVYSNLADGTLDAKLRHYVNDVPTDHTIYLGFNHEPEVKGDPTLFAQGVARAAQVIFDTGKTNIIPTFCLMDWTFQSYSGRNPDNWNPGVYLSDPEKAGVVAGVDGYAMAAPYQRTPNWLFSHPWDVYAGWGFDRWAIYECGVNQESVGRKDWMRALETHVNNKGVEMVCWWHSQVYKDAPENRWYILFLDYDQQAEPDSLQVWADIIGRNQSNDAPVVVIPPGDLPDPPVVDPPTHVGGNPVPITPGPPAIQFSLCTNHVPEQVFNNDDITTPIGDNPLTTAGDEEYLNIAQTNDYSLILAAEFALPEAVQALTESEFEDADVFSIVGEVRTSIDAPSGTTYLRFYVDSTDYSFFCQWDVTPTYDGEWTSFTLDADNAVSFDPAALALVASDPDTLLWLYAGGSASMGDPPDQLDVGFLAFRVCSGEQPNLAGAFDARRRRFARGPTANTG